ncbi:MAG: MFS transporter [Lachnospiraceae bacterium]|nr:MFS transporter [Lachnospiraceae bacterium]
MRPSAGGRPHYAWFILAGCCILQGASLGLIHNCAGVFYSPVCEELGFEIGKFTLYRTLYAISSALALPFVAKSFRKRDVRFVIGIASLVYGISTMAMGAFSELWQWYVTGLIQGAASAFLCMLPAPLLLGNWFYKKTGTAVGISAAFSGLVGMLGSSGLGFLIPTLGWRAAYQIVGAVSIGFILPTAVLILRYRPEEKGLRAYGEMEEKETQNSAGTKALGESSESFGTAACSGEENVRRVQGLSDFARQPVFYLCLAAFACSMISSCLNLFLTSLGLAAGLSMVAAAALTSFSLLGNMSSKLVLGKFSDSFGIMKALLLSTAVSVAGHLFLLAGVRSGMAAGAFLYGVTLPLSSVMLPLFCRLFWKGDNYGTAYSYVSMFGTLLASPFNMLFGRFYDWTGSYQVTVGASLVTLVLMLACVGLAQKQEKS